MINKKLAYMILAIVLLLSTYSSYGFFSGEETGTTLSPLSIYLTSKNKENISDSQEAVSNEPKTEECPLNGELLPKSSRNNWETRRPLGVMIENSKDARPQSGLSSADIIYEAVAEGGITRFLSIFYCKDAKPAGPVRSARIYFIRFLEEYGDYPLYAHVGGANCDPETGSGCANGAKADALGRINKLGWVSYNDINQFSVSFPVYWQDYERLPNVAVEHTVYTSTAKIWDYAKTKRKLSNIDEDGVGWDKSFVKWKFINDERLEKRGTTNKISFGFWSNFESDFAVNWNYNKNINSYSRVNGGQPHLDKNTGKQLQAKNIIIVFADESPAYDGYPGGHILYDIIGSGDALVFQNGEAIKASWEKVDESSRMKFYDSDSKEISMVRGQIFIELLPTGNKVTY